MKRILILTSLYTGHGHKSVSDALCERFEQYDDLEVRAIDGFALMNKVEQYMAENTYGPITRIPGKAWEWNYEAGQKLRKPVTKMVASMIKVKLLALLEDFKPDVILSLHPMFVGAVLDVLEEADLSIPLIAHEVDLVDIADYWFDPRVSLVLAPSAESYECTIAHGVPAEKVVRVGFPVRRRFVGEYPRAGHDGRVITVMSGAEGSGMIHTVVRTLLRQTGATINVICGRNRKLAKRLRKDFVKKHCGRVRVYGFVAEIQGVMGNSDLLVMRASPNSVMEAVSMRVPVILFGQLAGQELHNPEVLEAHGVAKYCPELSELPHCIEQMLDDSGISVLAMREAQRKYAPRDAAADTAALLRDWVYTPKS